MTKFISISEAVSIALHGMILIARSDEPVNVIKISDVTGTSRHHVAKIMQRLVKDNYLKSQRGPTGGFSLKKAPKHISFLEIYESIEGKVEISGCPMDKQICPFDECIMGSITNRMALEFKEYLEQQKLDKYI